MNEPIRLRYAAWFAAAFVLISVVVVVTLGLLAGRAQRWFQPPQRYSVQLPEAGSFGLREGAEVRVIGVAVGNVEAITVNDVGRMQARIAVQGDLARFIRQDSQVLIKKTFGLAGDAFLEISRGDGEPLEPDGKLSAAVTEELPGLAEQLVEQVRAEAVPTIRDIRAAVNEFRKLAADLRDPERPFPQAVRRANALMGRLERGEGAIGRLLNDPALADELEQAAARSNTILEDIDALLVDLRATTDRLPSIASSLDEELKRVPELRSATTTLLAELRPILVDVRAATVELPPLLVALRTQADALPGLTLQARDTLEAIEQLADALKRNWLVAPYVQPEEQESYRIQVGGD